MDNTRPSTVWVNGEKPELGDLATSEAVGRSGRALHVWEGCPTCGVERWIKLNTSGNLCKSCALRQHSFGESNRRWNPTRKTITKSGIRLYVDSSHPYFCMAHRCSRDFAILEHRLVMAEFLGRPLKVGEVVHHLDGDNTNNDINNLLLLPSQAYHSSYTLLQTHVRKLEKELEKVRTRLTLLEADNALLTSQVSKQGIGNPDLAGEDTLRARVETLHCPSQADEEKVHPRRKL